MNESNQTKIPDLHDSNLYAIEARDHIVKLCFERDEALISIIMDDVKGLWCGNFLAGNIVFDVGLYDADNFPFGPDAEGAGVVGSYIQYYGPIFSESDRALRVFLLNPSYGAELLVCFYGDINYSIEKTVKAYGL